MSELETSGNQSGMDPTALERDEYEAGRARAIDVMRVFLGQEVVGFAISLDGGPVPLKRTRFPFPIPATAAEIVDLVLTAMQPEADNDMVTTGINPI